MAILELSPSDPALMDDPFYPDGAERVKTAVLDLQLRGIVDAEGRRIRCDLPADMREDSARDFGG